MARKSVGGDYPPDWKQIARKVKDESAWCCIRCGHRHEPSSGHTLTVHHLDMNPANCRWWNLAALCQKCHLQIQHKVVMERPYYGTHSEWFKPYVAGYYAFHNQLPDDKESVNARIDELIALGQGGTFQAGLFDDGNAGQPIATEATR